MVRFGTIHEVMMMHGKIVYWLTVIHFANEDLTNDDTCLYACHREVDICSFRGGIPWYLGNTMCYIVGMK